MFNVTIYLYICIHVCMHISIAMYLICLNLSFSLLANNNLCITKILKETFYKIIVDHMLTEKPSISPPYLIS